MNVIFPHREKIAAAFKEAEYITDNDVLTALQLLVGLQKPLLVEGPAGVGKTYLAKVLAQVLDTQLIRLQCYEGLDVHQALYEWNYPKQILHIRLLEQDDSHSIQEKEAAIFDQSFLLQRPILKALLSEEKPAVLLIDEIDRADLEFEAFLLEMLAEFQVTIPELGTIQARHRPFVILTSNRTRQLSDALRRRCLYQWISYPDVDKEKAILAAKLPEIDQQLAAQIARFMTKLRQQPLQKMPGIAESLDWAAALILLHRHLLDADSLAQTLGCILKDPEDWKTVQEYLKEDAHFWKKLQIESHETSS